MCRSAIPQLVVTLQHVVFAKSACYTDDITSGFRDVVDHSTSAVITGWDVYGLENKHLTQVLYFQLKPGFIQ